ncbi:MAG: PAS domain-containing protein, partial [Candidatus Rokubacteria bacterium]|nr:PAS domain-containing protein [Candidatus Rokubacteria bacterium]
AIAMVVSLVPVAALLALAWPRLTLHLEPEELVALLVGILAVALLIPVTRDLAGRLLDRYVYRTHVNYRRTLREASEALTRALDLSRLLPLLNHTVAASTNAEGAAVYLAGGAGITRAIAETRDAPGGFTAPAEAPAVVLQALQASRDLLLTDEVARERPTPERQRLHAALSEAGWALVLPLLSESQVIGAIVVGPKLSGDPFYPQDLDLLMTLANQAGIAVKNAQLYAQVVLANEHRNNIVTTIESGVVAVDAGGEITLFNRAAERLTGIPAAQARTRPVAALPACLGQALRDTLAAGAARTQPEVELSDGTVTRPIICTTSPLHDPEGRLLGAVAVFSDLTPLKELEIERRRAERLAYFEMLAAGIAHEIKNPLVAIKTFAQLLPRKQGDPKFSEDFGRIVTREIGRMERLLERLRTMARPGERPVHALDLRAPLGDALEATRPAFNEKSIVVSTATGPRPCLVLGDHAELEQLFLNLLMNAHEATPPRGMVRVELAVGAARATVAVVDTGPGIPNELLDRVFDPFFTTKQRGSGLGLAICASIAQRHGARLRAGNRPTGGAAFTLEFPLAVTPAPVSA